MSLQHYTETFWFSSGVLAASVQAAVFPENSSSFATLYADAAGTIPLANPTSTDASGVLDFWAESGSYWVHLDSESFLVPVGASVNDGHLSTGIASGGRLSVNGANPQAVDITAVDGYVITFNSASQTAPSVVRVKTPAQTVALSGPALTRQITWWLMDSTGAVLQQATKPTNVQRRTHLVLGVTFQDTVAGQIVITLTQPTILQQPTNQLADLMDALGPFVVFGGMVTPNGANLLINQGAGEIFTRAFNHVDGAGNFTQDPHLTPLAAQTPATFRYCTRAANSFGPFRTTLDVANYDVGGVITPLGGGTNTSTIHRVWVFAAKFAVQQVAIQYGQTPYSSLAAAVAAIGKTDYQVNADILSDGRFNGTLAGWIAAIRTATNLSDPAQAVFVPAGKFVRP